MCVGGGGGDDERKICWVNWEKICQEKKEGGWVKSLKEFNQALLAKWRWRMTCSNKVYDVNYLKQNMETFFTLGGDGKESVRWKDFFESYLRCGRGGMV